MKSLTEGRIVHFVMPDGQHRPAIVVRKWNDYNGCCNLQVFLDGTNDANSKATREQMDTGIMWVTSAEYSDTKGQRTWHWPEHTD